jgi:hypothetical protein
MRQTLAEISSLPAVVPLREAERQPLGVGAAGIASVDAFIILEKR